MITRLKRKDTGAGTKRLVFRKASGADTMAPITVPIKAMHTVSSKRYPSPSFSPAENPVWLQKASKHISQSLWTGSGKIRQGKGKRADQKQGSQKQKQQSGLLFFYCALFSYQGIRECRLKYSITHTVRNSISRMVPTLSYSNQEIFSLRSSPIPPAPTYPKMELCHQFFQQVKCIGEENQE